MEAADPLGIPVYPAMPFGLAPYFAAFPGSVSLRVETLLAVARDLVASVARSGFRRILIVNGHGGNAPVGALAHDLMAEYPSLSIKFHSWWNAPRTWAARSRRMPPAATATGLENFPWTRLAHAPAPQGAKAAVDLSLMKVSGPATIRAMLADGSFGGAWPKPDDVMARLWAEGVAKTRAALEGPWPD